MSIECIPGEHIVHMLESLKKAHLAARGAQSTTQIDDAIYNAKSFAVEDRKRALNFLEKKIPGVTARLSGLWGFSGKRSVQLWELPVFFQESVGTFSNRIQKQEKDKISSNAKDWQDVPSSKLRKGHDRVTKVLLDYARNEARAMVTLTSNTSITYEGTVKVEPRTFPVELRVSFAHSNPILEVQATILVARRAMFTFLDWVLGYEVPKKKTGSHLGLVEARQHVDRLQVEA